MSVALSHAPNDWITRHAAFELDAWSGLYRMTGGAIAVVLYEGVDDGLCHRNR